MHNPSIVEVNTERTQVQQIGTSINLGFHILSFPHVASGLPAAGRETSLVLFKRGFSVWITDDITRG
jgi:hypothetical protein